MDPSLSAPARPAVALPPRPARRRGLWALPLALSLLFVGGVLAWMISTQHADVEVQRLELISDALSLESQVGTRLETERQHLRELALHIKSLHPSPQAFAALPEVPEGLHRFWVSITWLDASHRIVVHLPEQQPRPDAAVQRSRTPSTGVSAHLALQLADGGTLVVRYSPTDILRQGVPWW